MRDERNFARVHFEVGVLLTELGVQAIHLGAERVKDFNPEQRTCIIPKLNKRLTFETVSSKLVR